MSNKIVEKFVETELPLIEILKKFSNPNQELEKVFLEIVICKESGQLKKEHFDKIDMALKVGHENSNAYFLFLSYLIAFSIQSGQLEKGFAYHSLLKTIPIEDIAMPIKAFYLQNMGRLEFENDNVKECLDYLNQLRNLFKYSFKRIVNYKINNMNMFGGMGYLNELDSSDLPTAKEAEKVNLLFSFYFAQLINFAYTGDFFEGMKLYSVMKSMITGNEIKNKIIEYYYTFQLLSNDFDETLCKDERFNLHAVVCKSISEGNFSKANLEFSALNKTIWQDQYKPFLIPSIEINLELSQHNLGKVKLLLHNRLQKGNTNFINDLYLGRIQILERKYSEANITFRRLQGNVKKYKAFGRLKFELNLAKDLRFDYALRLMNEWEDIISPSIKPLNVNVAPFSSKGLSRLIGNSKEMLDLKNQIKVYSNMRDIILITGETGTGKELVAMALHEEGIDKNEQFLSINCGALTDTLLESELFGYEKGAFTGAQVSKSGIFESAGKGTVFLDEFGEISPKLQVSLLRVFESKEIRPIGSSYTKKVNCRIIVATNVELKNQVLQKKFREDLFYRLSRFEIKLLPLRDRIDDILPLAQFFIDKNNEISGQKKFFSNELLGIFKSYSWPGNIRQLKNEIDRLYILNSDKQIIDTSNLEIEHFKELTVNVSPVYQKHKKHLPLDKPDIHQIINNDFTKEKRHNYIKELFHQYQKLTRKQISKITNYSTTTISKDLSELCNEKFIERISPTQSKRTDYFKLV